MLVSNLERSFVFSKDLTSQSNQVTKNSKDNSFGEIFNKQLDNKASNIKDNKAISDKKEDNINLVKSNNNNETKEVNDSSDIKEPESKSLDETNKDLSLASLNDEEVKLGNLSLIDEKANEIMEKISDLLDMDVKEVASIMESLNISNLDLFDINKLTTLYVEANGQGEIALVVDGEFNINLNQLIDFVRDIKEELSSQLEIGLDELNKVLSNGLKDFKELLKETKEDKTNKGEAKADIREDTFALTKEKSPVSEEVHTDNTQDESLEDLIASKLRVETNNMSGENEAKAGDNKDNLNFNKAKDNSPNISKDNYMASNFVKDFSQAIEGQLDSKISQVDVARQVIDQIKLINTDSLKSIEVMLNPESLGSVHITVSQKEGIITAQLTASTEAAKKALENQMLTLKENFNNQGIKVEAVEVSVESHAFENGGMLNQQDSNKNFSKNKTKPGKIDLSSITGLDINELSSDEIKAKDLIENGDASVSYLA